MLTLNVFGQRADAGSRRAETRWPAGPIASGDSSARGRIKTTLDAWIDTVRDPHGNEIILAMVRKGSIPNRWVAQRFATALKIKLPLGKIGLEVVVVDGEPKDDPRIFATAPEIEAYVRDMLPNIGAHRWQETKIDW